LNPNSEARSGVGAITGFEFGENAVHSMQLASMIESGSPKKFSPIHIEAA
jgi:hypothetical protein